MNMQNLPPRMHEAPDSSPLKPDRHELKKSPQSRIANSTTVRLGARYSTTGQRLPSRSTNSTLQPLWVRSSHPKFTFPSPPSWRRPLRRVLDSESRLGAPRVAPAPAFAGAPPVLAWSRSVGVRDQNSRSWCTASDQNATQFNHRNQKNISTTATITCQCCCLGTNRNLLLHVPFLFFPAFAAANQRPPWDPTRGVSDGRPATSTGTVTVSQGARAGRVHHSTTD